MHVITDISKNLPPGSTAPESGIAGMTEKLNSELEKWKNKEERQNYEVLKRYWEHIGWDESEWDPSSVPWSGAFVSFLAPGLPGSAAHWEYVQHVIDGKGSGWSAYKIDKGTVLNVGDIVIKNRGSGGLKGTQDYYKSHGDIVHSVLGDRVSLVGGNLGSGGSGTQTAKLTGTIPRKGNQHSYLIVLKKKKRMIAPLLVLGVAAIAALWIKMR